MALIIPQGKLTYYDPGYDGITDLLGLSRDWRPSEKWGGTWVELIKPLGCLAPEGDLRPQSMNGIFVAHPTYNANVREVWGPGNPATIWAEFGDGAVYAAGTAVTTYAAALITDQTDTSKYWAPNLTVRMARSAPPAGQGIMPETTIMLRAQVQVSLTTALTYVLDPVNGTWMDGQVVVSWPFFGGSSNKAFLAFRVARDGSNPLQIYSSHEYQGGMEGGLQSSCWVIEYVEDTTLFPGGHILIRCAAQPQEWWHTYSECIRLENGPVSLAMAGCKQQVNVSPIYYSDSTGSYSPIVYPQEHKPLPSLRWNTAATWASLYSTATGWTVTTEAADAAGVQLAQGYRPKITFDPGGAARNWRPVLWFATEDHFRTVKTKSAVSSQDTDGDGVLHTTTLNISEDQKQWSGSAEFYSRDTALYPAWLERGKLVLNMGWQTGAGTGLAAADVATVYIRGGGIKRERDGEQQSGAPQLRIDYADYLQAVLEDSAVVDYRQAGGQKAGEWFEECGARMGLSTLMITVDPAVANVALPVAMPPSRPNLAPQDGDTWARHLDEVTAAANLRWRWASDGLHLDAGAPVYAPGTSTLALTLDYNTLTPEDTIWQIEHLHDGSGHRNAVKLVYGQQGRQKEAYYLAPVDEREEAGVELWASLEAQEGDDVTALTAEFVREHRGQVSQIAWSGPLRVGLLPDMFVKIGDVPELGLETNAVYQITGPLEWYCSTHERRATGRLVAKLVYSPAAALVGGTVASSAVGSSKLGM